MMKMTHRMIYNGLILSKKSSVKETEKILQLTTYGIKTTDNSKNLQRHHLKMKIVSKSEDYDHFI